MSAHGRHLDWARSICGAELDTLCAIAGELTSQDLVLATACAGWRVADLLCHIRAGTEELVLAFAEPTQAPADRDFVTYWQDWPPKGPPSFEDVRLDWAMASMWARSEHLLGYFSDRVGAAAKAVKQAPAGNLRFQGHVMSANDIVAMWAVEFVVHHLDLSHQLPHLPGPATGGLELVAATLDELTSGTCPREWDLRTYALKGTGRLALDAEDRKRLGERADNFPAFG